MKTTNILLLSFLIFIAGCSWIDSITKSDKMEIVRAGYTNWSEPPERGDVPERGTNLAVIVKNWPEGATPQHIIYEKHQSLGAEITGNSELGVIINARIVRATTRLPQTSQEVSLSDRLVYTDANGNEQHIEIAEWTRIEEEAEEESTGDEQ